MDGRYDKDNPPIFWDFKGHASAWTYFELRVIGRPSAKALRNVVKQIEVTIGFLEEDERRDREGNGTERPLIEGEGSRDEPLPNPPPPAPEGES